MTDPGRVRDDYHLAADGFVEVLAHVSPDGWDAPGLGVWTVRDLAGHTSRALLTVESYLDPSTTTSSPSLADAEAYFAAAAAAAPTAAARVQRGVAGALRRPAGRPWSCRRCCSTCHPTSPRATSSARRAA